MRSNKPVNRLQAGFTLIELIIVIVIVGIMAAVAIPKYNSITTDAQQASVTGIAGNLASASAMNYALRTGIPGKGVAVADCAAVADTLLGGLPTGYVIADGLAGALPLDPGPELISCKVTLTGTSITAAFLGQTV